MSPEPGVPEPGVPESGLIDRARLGEEGALEELIRTYQQRVARFVVTQTGDWAHCEDLCQAIFVKMVLGIRKLDSPAAFEAWLFRIARNACTDHLRRQRWRRKLFVPLEARHESIAPEPMPATDGRGEEVAGALLRLAVGQRQLVALSIERPRSYEELASLTGTSVPSVKSRLFRARERLRGLLKVGGHGDD
jgi:RNA polymerase sigma-70 factor (ECF subfamily)